jgi:hypothetical protein
VPVRAYHPDPVIQADRLQGPNARDTCVGVTRTVSVRNVQAPPAQDDVGREVAGLIKQTLLEAGNGKKEGWESEEIEV